MQPWFQRRQRLFKKLTTALLFTTAATSTWADGNPQEARELTLALKQLQNVQAIIKRAEAQSRASNWDLRTSRYEFDYELIQSDLDRIAEGVRGYLTPSRAQPRDLGRIDGDYSRDRGAP
ncbi:integrative conjugative element protein, RAQPRD family [Pseudomonas lopnurensis]|uniref:integrative conjugative element protein, RAQPRD family n=1 Tax=Pseudomonas lopnurensis TaxID=1477517 RepID=UPI0028AF8A6E|nr:RAQPRD family integrative conjugative element protein [Pseudomonas lopnurensis]